MTEVTALDHLFNGVASGDLDQSRAALAPDVRVWHGFDGIAHDRDAIMASLPILSPLFRSDGSKTSGASQRPPDLSSSTSWWFGQLMAARWHGRSAWWFASKRA